MEQTDQVRPLLLVFRRNQIVAARRAKDALDPAAPAAPTLLHRLDTYEQTLVAALVPDVSDPVRRGYERFAELDAILFPLEMVGELHEKDIIETVRISPLDARKGFSGRETADKIAGDALYHSGGFFKRSWRANDILWGRVDGLCQLVESLLTRDRVAELAGSATWRSQLRAALLRAEQRGRW